MKLSIRCRGGRTELVVAGPGISGRGDNYAISYRVNDGQQLQIAAALPASGAGVAFGGDVIRLLQSLPDSWKPQCSPCTPRRDRAGWNVFARRVGSGAREDGCCVQMVTPSRESEQVMVFDEVCA